MNRLSTILRCALLLCLVLMGKTLPAGLEVTLLGKDYQPDREKVPIIQDRANMGGNTSVRNTDRDHLIWKTQGYYQRNRDLGQVFTPQSDLILDAIILRTGPADSAVLAGAPGAEVFLQLFEVEGRPELNDNGTPRGTAAKHGFSKNHRCDDYLTGVRYVPIMRAEGGRFPDLAPTKDLQGNELPGQNGRLTYLRWDLTGEDEVTLKSGKRYAFMVGFTEPGAHRGFTLANDNRAGRKGPASLGGVEDAYAGGWAVRREGDGSVPPTMQPGESPPGDPRQREKMYRQSLFPSGESRYRLQPTTDGYPDVDTYRDLEFYIEIKKTS